MVTEWRKVLDFNKFQREQVFITDAGRTGPEQNDEVQKAEINLIPKKDF